MILTLLLSLFLQTADASEKEAAQELPLAARKALTAWNFKFKIFGESNFTSEVQGLFKNLQGALPMRVEGDFNNDKKTDYILMGSAGKQEFVVALVSDKESFKPVVVRQAPYTEGATTSSYLIKVKPGEIPGRTQKYDLVQVETFAGATGLFEIKNFKAKKLN